MIWRRCRGCSADPGFVLMLMASSLASQLPQWPTQNPVWLASDEAIRINNNPYLTRNPRITTSAKATTTTATTPLVTTTPSRNASPAAGAKPSTA